MPAIKELHYFDYLYVPENRGWAHKHIKKTARNAILRHLIDLKNLDPGHVKYLYQLATVDVFSESWYSRAFDRAAARGKVIGDITPSYCTLPREGIEYVKSLLGDIRLIYIIRDPVDRALSHIRMKAQRKYGRRVSKLNEAQWREVAMNTRVANRGNYKDYIQNWLSVFDERNMLFIPFRMIKDDSLRVMGMVEQHLGLSNYTGYSSPNTPAHVTTKVAIPDCVTESLAEELQVQREFLRSYFDSDFYSMI